MADTAITVADAADRYFQEGVNCAQAVLRAVAEARGLVCSQCIPGIALGMGGGVGHTGHICGAATGGVMAIGLAVDKVVSSEPAEKRQAAYRAAGRLVREFAAVFGSADCRDILGFDLSEPGALERARLENIKPCKCTPCVRWAAEEADRLIAEIRDAPH
ncbi:MAG: C-GCAxxG-C-C family protein [Planctomycetota bacterium]|nr:C-GCAxxG-C-C family protein [Planctomycetota bacterium]